MINVLVLIFTATSQTFTARAPGTCKRTAVKWFQEKLYTLNIISITPFYLLLNVSNDDLYRYEHLETLVYRDDVIHIEIYIFF